MSKKRTIDAFFGPSVVKRRRLSDVPPAPGFVEQEGDAEEKEQDREGQTKEEAGFSRHRTYPFPIRDLPSHLTTALQDGPGPGRGAQNITRGAALDLLYFHAFIPRLAARGLFEFLRAELPFYRVEYTVKRAGKEKRIRTPRYTSVFGLDDTAVFDDNGDVASVVGGAGGGEAGRRYQCAPRVVPGCLSALMERVVQAVGRADGGGEKRPHFNFVLVNYYASGSDSIAPHSDDERFLGPLPTIASLSLGQKRDFVVKHKTDNSEAGRLRLALQGGDMVIMRGETQSKWLHSVPKRKGDGIGGRINITFRRAIGRGGTDNYYHYNVGQGRVYRWDGRAGQMRIWEGQSAVGNAKAADDG